MLQHGTGQRNRSSFKNLQQPCGFHWAWAQVSTLALSPIASPITTDGGWEVKIAGEHWQFIPLNKMGLDIKAASCTWLSFRVSWGEKASTRDAQSWPAASASMGKRFAGL